ncbi:MMS19 nucleotide excision repair protein [Dermacentor variabilis]|uniref:MMS19 nucleotide excision repair protein n=1 Tax=Dermacentor variabilis TaxID=34621 RepID=UPI003F5B2CFA
MFKTGASAAMDASPLNDGDDKFEEEVARYVNVIKEDKDQLLQMLESMGHILTHKDYQRRATGVRVITNVIQLLPQRYLGKEQTTTLLDYYLSKLEDHPIMVPFAIRGLYELVVNQDEVDDTEIEKLLQAILYDVQMPGLLQAERYLVYRMLAYMLLNYTSALHNMGSKFVHGCIQAIEGERDPRCLLQVFAIIPMICNNFILGELEESLFEVCACYFPIDFNPPASDAGKISREDLAEALLMCMTASAGFGKYCVPLAVEKLDSDLTVAKLDSLKLLIHGAEVFPPACFTEKTVLIWKQIHNLVFVNRHEAIIPTALNCLASVARVISHHKNGLTALFKVVWKDLQRGEAPGMGRVFETFASASSEACSVALVEALPSVLQLLSKNEGLRPVLVLESTTAVLSLYAALCNHQEATPELYQLLGLLADLLCTLLAGSDELALRAVKALHTVLPIKSFLTESQLQIVKGLLLHVATCEDAPAPRDEHVLLLATAAKTASLSEEIWFTLKQEIEKGYHPGKTERIMKIATACGGSTSSLSILLPLIEEHFVCAITEFQIWYRNQLANCLTGIACQAQKYKVSFHHSSLLKKIVVAWMDTVKHGNENESSETFAEVAHLLYKLSEMCSNRDMKDIISLVEEACVETSLANSSLLLLECIVCHARPEALSANQHLVKLLINAHCQGTCQHVAQCLAGYVNKLPSADLEETLGCLWPCLKPEWTAAKAELLLWVIKALLLRGYPDLAPYTKLLKDLLKDGLLGRHVAKGFRQILQPSVLTTEGHCTIMLMHPQRFFVETVDFLIEGFNSATGEAVKENFLMGLCCQLAYVPKPVVNTYIDEILPILVTALSSAEESIIGECVLPCLTENVGLMVSCLNSVLVQLLRLAKPPFSMEVRRSALECLLRLSTIEENKLLPYRQQVVQGLTQCLADHKRVVRQVAAQASSMWHMVGEPKGV